VTYNPKHYWILVAQVFRVQAIAAIAFRSVEPAHFTNPKINAGSELAVIYMVAKNYFARFKTLPDLAAFEAEFASQIARGTVSEAAKTRLRSVFDEFVGFATKVDSRSERLARDLINHIAVTCVVNPQMRETLSDALSTGNYDGLSSKVSEIELIKTAVRGGLARNDIFSADLEGYGDRRPTGVPFIDSRLGDGRGPVTGTAMAIIAPQGHGKTSLGIQLCVAQALTGNNALIALAEEGLSKPLRRRIAAAALGIPTPVLERNGDDYLQAANEVGLNLDTARKKMAMVAEHLYVLDMVREELRFEAIEAQIQEMQASNKLPAYVYVDWAGIIATKLLETAPKDSKHMSTKEQALKVISYTVADWAAKFGINIVISHQMSPAAIKKGPTADNTMTCGADCGGFTEPMKYCFIINPRTKEGHNVVTVAKSRDDALPPRFVVKLRGEMATFVDVSDSFTVSAGRVISTHGVRDDEEIP